MPKSSFSKNGTDTIYPISVSDKWVHAFWRSTCPKVNVIKLPVFEIAYFEDTVKHVSNYSPGNPTIRGGCRIHRLLLCRGVIPNLTSILDMTLNNVIVRFQ